MFHDLDDPAGVARFLAEGRQLQRDILELKRLLAERKFDPKQYRRPKGQPGGGQWAKEGGATPVSNDGQRPIVEAARRPPRDPPRTPPALARYCEEQFQRDLVVCDSARRTRRPACYGQAMLRKANCERGLQIPPLNF